MCLPFFRSSGPRACRSGGFPATPTRRDPPLRPARLPLASPALGQVFLRSRARLLRGTRVRVTPRPLRSCSVASLAAHSPWRQTHPQPWPRLRCLGPKTGWRPAGPSARDGAVPAGHLPPAQKGEEASQPRRRCRGIRHSGIRVRVIIFAVTVREKDGVLRVVLPPSTWAAGAGPTASGHPSRASSVTSWRMLRQRCRDRSSVN